MRISRFTLLACLVSSLTLFSCQEASAPDPGDTDDGVIREEGLTILEFQPESDFKAMFVRGDDVILLEAVRGQPTPEQYRSDPASPQHEVDARITDHLGRILYLRRGGDHFVDPAWQDDLEWQENLPAFDGSNVALFEMAAEASGLLEDTIAGRFGAASVARILPELRSIQDFGVTARLAVAESERMLAAHVGQHGFLAGAAASDALPLAGGGGSSSGSEDGAKSLAAAWYWIAVYDKSCCMGLGRHSATRIQRVDGGASFAIFDFCNHGECPSDSAMSHKCRLTMTNKPAWTARTCTTDYSAFSNNGHNCHDDTRVQLASFVYGAPNTGKQYWCSDGDSGTDISNGTGDQSGSPECNNSMNKGYNHKDMLYFDAWNTASATTNTANFDVELAAGATYEFSTCGQSSTDTYLRLYRTGARIAELASNDDACGVQSKITYKAMSSGTFQVRVGCYGTNSCNGRLVVTLISSDPPPCVPAGDRLCPGEELLPGQYRMSPDGRFRLTYQGDGNLVLYRWDWVPLWGAGSNSTAGRAVMQGDGNLVVYNASWSARWSSNTYGGHGAYLQVFNWGNAMVVDAFGGVLWWSGWPYY